MVMQNPSLSYYGGRDIAKAMRRARSGRPAVLRLLGRHLMSRAYHAK